MTDLDAVLQAILEHPDDDLPRLQFADLVEEQGQGERAELIRVQLRLTKSPCWHDDSKPHLDCASCPLRRREQELFDITCDGFFGKRHEDGLLFFLWDWSRTTERRNYDAYTGNKILLVRRGFVEAIRLSWHDWRTHADTLTARHPIREVRLTTWPECDFVLYRGEGKNKTMVTYRQSSLPVALKNHWPKIRFELPRFTPVNWEIIDSTPSAEWALLPEPSVPDIIAQIEAIKQEFQKQIIQSMGIPKNIFNPQ